MIAWRRRHESDANTDENDTDIHEGGSLMERRGRLAGKVALITGVAKEDGIGFATARVFADEEAAGIAVVDIADGGARLRRAPRRRAAPATPPT